MIARAQLYEAGNMLLELRTITLPEDDWNPVRSLLMDLWSGADEREEQQFLPALRRLQAITASAGDDAPGEVGMAVLGDHDEVILQVVTAIDVCLAEAEPGPTPEYVAADAFDRWRDSILTVGSGDVVIGGGAYLDEEAADAAEEPEAVVEDEEAELEEAAAGEGDLGEAAEPTALLPSETPAEGATPSGRELRRIPHLDLSSAPVEPGTVFEVEVYLDRQAAKAGEEVTDFVIVDAEKLPEQIDIRVHLTVSDHFEIQGDSVSGIRLERDGDSDKAVFAVSAVADPDGSPAWIAASFAYQLRPSGMVRRFVDLDDAVDRAAPEPGDEVQAHRIEAGSAPPDMVIEVTRRPDSTNSYDVVVATTLLGEVTERTGRWALDVSAPELVAASMKNFFKKSATPAARRASLIGAGWELFKSSPECFQELWWELVAAGKTPASVLVVSEEPSVPWELMVPMSDDTEDPIALGVQCDIGRWTVGDHVAPPNDIPLDRSIVVAPVYKGTNVLKHAPAEADLVLAAFPGDRFDPATFDNIDPWFAERSASLLHFVCHGENDLNGQQVLRLSGEDVLDSQQLVATKIAASCRRSRPLVFLNACEVGGSVPGLVSPRSLAASFAEVKARAVIAPLWAVNDGVAHKFAEAFYAAVAEEGSAAPAHIISELRARAYSPEAQPGDDTYAAYCWFGDPLALVVVS